MQWTVEKAYKEEPDKAYHTPVWKWKYSHTDRIVTGDWQQAQDLAEHLQGVSNIPHRVVRYVL